jgi:hypothetical protein
VDVDGLSYFRERERGRCRLRTGLRRESGERGEETSCGPGPHVVQVGRHQLHQTGYRRKQRVEQHFRVDQDVKEQEANQHKAKDGGEHYDSQEETAHAPPPDQPQGAGRDELLCERKIVPLRGWVSQNGVKMSACLGAGVPARAYQNGGPNAASTSWVLRTRMDVLVRKRRSGRAGWAKMDPTVRQRRRGR